MGFPKSDESIYAISPYIGGDVTPPGFVRRVVLASNENPYGPSDAVKQVVRQYTDRIHCYPSGAANELRAAIGQTHGIDPAWIVTGNGSEDILHLLARAYLGKGDEVLIPQHGFGVYKIATLAMGGIPVEIPRVNFKLNVDAILERVTPRTKIFYLDHPGNPIAHYLTNTEIDDLLERMPSHVLVVFDSAYAEYMDGDDYHCGTKWVQRYPNVVMARSFSKAYGMANLRLGWLYAHPEIVDPISRIRPPFNISSVASAAGIAALADRAHLERAVKHNAQWLPWLTDEISALGLEVLPSVANFIAIRFPNIPGQTAADADHFLTQRGLILRAIGAYGMGDFLRLTVGAEEANRAVVSALKEFRQGAKGNSDPHA